MLSSGSKMLMSLPNQLQGTVFLPHAYRIDEGMHRGYYMAARGYEFYLEVFNSISHVF